MSVPPRRDLKAALKRGALIAAANWPVTFIQWVADSLFKLLIAAPLIGGTFLVALVVGADPGALVTLDWRELVATIVTSLLSKPLVLVAFLLALSVVIVGGSLFMFLVKAGTVGVLALGEREADAIELPPLHIAVVARASRFSIDMFIQSARGLFPRYARLGFLLMAVYAASAGIYLGSMFASGPRGWAMTALLTLALVVWVTFVNLVYLLMQLVIAADDCSVAAAATRVGAFLRRERGTVTVVFVVILALVVFATGASLLATAALGLIAFVPLVGLAVLPLQLLAWLLRGIVFQYIGLSSIGAYLNVYRTYSAALDGRVSAASYQLHGTPWRRSGRPGMQP